MSEQDYWVKIREGKREEPETLALALLLGIETDLVVGKLHRFWTWVGRRSADGRLPGVPPAVIDAAVECVGFAEGMLDASVAWLGRDADGVLYCPDWERMNGNCAARRAADARERRRRGAERKRKQRAAERDEPTESAGSPRAVTPLSRSCPRTDPGNRRQETDTDIDSEEDSFVESSRVDHVDFLSKEESNNPGSYSKARETLERAVRRAGEITQAVLWRRDDARNRVLAWKVAVLAETRIPEAWLADSLAAVAEKRKQEGPKWEGWGYFYSCLRNKAAAGGVKIEPLLASVPEWTCPIRGSPVSEEAVQWMVEK